MNRLFARLRGIVWLAVLAAVLLLAAVVIAMLGDPATGAVLALAGIGFVLLARET
jgi:hypothetical protein